MKKLFILPPVEKRRDISRSWINPVFNGKLSKEHNDLYIYWRCYFIGAIVSVAYVVLYQANYFLDMGLPIQFFYEHDPIRNFSYSYSLMSFPLTIFVSAYSFILLLLNVNLKEFDLTWFENEKHRKRNFIDNGKRYAENVVKIRAFLLPLFCVFWGVGPTIILEYSLHKNLESSDTYLFFIGYLTAALHIVVISMLPAAIGLRYQLHKGWFRVS